MPVPFGRAAMWHENHNRADGSASGRPRTRLCDTSVKT